MRPRFRTPNEKRPFVFREIPRLKPRSRAWSAPFSHLAPAIRLLMACRSGLMMLTNSIILKSMDSRYTTCSANISWADSVQVRYKYTTATMVSQDVTRNLTASLKAISGSSSSVSVSAMLFSTVVADWLKPFLP